MSRGTVSRLTGTVAELQQWWEGDLYVPPAVFSMCLSTIEDSCFRCTLSRVVAVFW